MTQLTAGDLVHRITAEGPRRGSRPAEFVRVYRPLSGLDTWKERTITGLIDIASRAGIEAKDAIYCFQRNEFGFLAGKIVLHWAVLGTGYALLRAMDTPIAGSTLLNAGYAAECAKDAISGLKNAAEAAIANARGYWREAANSLSKQGRQEMLEALVTVQQPTPEFGMWAPYIAANAQRQARQ